MGPTVRLKREGELEVPEKTHDDMELVREILAGSTKAWHCFIERYSGLIYSVLRRHLYDDEGIRSVYVDTLERLYKGTLETFEGRSALSTWLVLVARSCALDHLRRQFGRRELPAAIKRLKRRDQQIFRLYFLEGLSVDAVRHWAAEQGQPIGLEELADTLRRIETEVGPRVMRRIAYDVCASSVGAASGRMLEFLDWHRAKQEEKSRRRTPEQDLLDKEARATADRARELLEQLPQAERMVLKLRYEKGWTAAKIAEELGLESPRRAYTAIDRGLRLLRNLLNTKS